MMTIAAAKRAQLRLRVAEVLQVAVLDAAALPARKCCQSARMADQPNLNKMPWPPRGYSQATLRCSVQMMRQLPHSRQPSVISVTLPLPSVL